MKLLVINGPNINMLGIREKNIYGDGSFEDLQHYILEVCKKHNVECELFQSNHEGEIVDKIQEAYSNVDAILINPAAYTHTSVAILDALSAVCIPCAEVHLSDIYIREEFRHHSYVSLVAKKTFYGMGFKGYKKAIEFLVDYCYNESIK